MTRRPSPLARLLCLLADRRGATVVEYGLVCALIVLAMLASLKGVANGTISIWNGVSVNIVGAR